MVGVSHELLSQASKEVQIADRLLSDIYDLSGEPRLLLRAAVHICRAADLAQDATGEDFPDDTRSVISSLRDTLQEYKEAPTAFLRKKQLVIASQDFENLDRLSKDRIVSSLQVIKDYVYESGKQVLLGRV